ncbi:MAG: hypothetical protein H0X40_12615 [Chthoniobacterales bacterium]|nr:hypothetical protein [Chthoniobacterales bacterium]
MIDPNSMPNERNSSSSRSIICTLFEGDYHLGLGALINSLYARGFRGELYAGFRGELPPWTRTRAQKNGAGWLYQVGEGYNIHFLPVSTEKHLNNYKADFVLALMSQLGPETEKFFFFDPDIIVRVEWDFFERWAAQGIAVCEDINDYLPRNHPVRQAWKEYARQHELPIRQEQDRFYNGGFFGLRREEKDFLECWKELFELRARNGADLGGLRLCEFSYPYLSNDQDLMNLALMLVDHTISGIGPEGMGFRPGGYVMSHAAGEIKSWRKRFVWEALKGRAPTGMDKEFVQYTRTPIEVCSGPQLALKRMAVKVGSLIGRFYARGGV